jgi:hypothetical protein
MISVSCVVQLGGLEPPTSCSTDRRSNQLSYNCILGRARKKGLPNGRETRCKSALWQGQAGGNIGRGCDLLLGRDPSPQPLRASFARLGPLEVGYIRLRQYWMPNSGKPELGGERERAAGAFTDQSHLGQARGFLASAPTSKKPGLAARAFFWNGNVRFCDQKPRKDARSGGRLEQLGRVGLDRLDGFSGNPLGQFGEFLGVRGEGLELLAGMRGPQLHRFGGRFHAEQGLREVEVRGGAGLDDFDQLGGVFGRALAGGGEHRLHGAVMAFGDILELGVVIAGLRDALFGEGAHLLGDFERDHGGGERVGWISHGMHLSQTGVKNVTPTSTAIKLRTPTWIYADRVTGMPFVRQPLVNTHIMSILCNATKFNVRRGILPLKGTRFRPQSTIQGAKSCPGSQNPALWARF